MYEKGISTAVIKRLPRYYRYLGELLAHDVVRISSKGLSERMGVTASQIRQDLNNFGGFGQQGYGYNVEYLYTEIGKILGLDKKNRIIIVGAGNLGQAIANYSDFERRGFEIIGIFDVNPELTGVEVAGIKIRHTDDIEKFCEENQPVVAVLCIPKANTQRIADALVKFGVKAFWNFSHYDLSIDYENIAVENVHLGDSLLTLTYGANNICDANEYNK